MVNRIVFTGTESTFKSRLAEKLAQTWNCSVCPEMARIYLEKALEKDEDFQTNPLDPIHFENISQLQYDTLKSNQYFSAPTEIGLFDTDGITLKIWAQYKFPTLQQAWWTDIPEGTLYVLCAPTNEYFKDPLRHDQENRETLHRTYEQLLSELGLPVFLLEEPLFEDRWKELLGKLEQKGIRRPY